MLLVSAMAAVATCAAPNVFIRVLRAFNFPGPTPSAESSRWAVGAQLLSSTASFSEKRRLLARAYRVSEVLVNCVIPMAAMLVVQPILWLCFLAVSHALPILCIGGVPGMRAVLREPYILIASAQESMLVSGAWKPGTHAALRWAYLRNVLVPFACFGFWISGFRNPLGINTVGRWYGDPEQPLFNRLRRGDGKGSNRLCSNLSTEHCLPGPQIGILYLILGCAIAALGIAHLLWGFAIWADSPGLPGTVGENDDHHKQATAAVCLAHDVEAAVRLANDTVDVNDTAEVTQAGLNRLEVKPIA